LCLFILIVSVEKTLRGQNPAGERCPKEQNMRFTETDDLIDIRKDNVFKAVFTKKTPESLGALAALISSLIDRNVSIITILANEPPIENLLDRQIRFDIACEVNDGELVNIEMSLYPTHYEPAKLEYYSTRLFMGQEIRGVDKSFDDLMETYQIAILAKDKFFPDDDVFHEFEYYDKKRNVSLNGRSRIITVELSKVDNITDLPAEEMSKAEHWAYYFENLTDPKKREKINQIIECQEGIKMASVVLGTISRDMEERYRLECELKNELEAQSARVYAKRLTEKVERLTEEVNHKDAILADKDAKLADKDAILADKDAILADKDAKLADKDATIADKDATIANYAAENAQLRAELEKQK